MALKRVFRLVSGSFRPSLVVKSHFGRKLFSDLFRSFGEKVVLRAQKPPETPDLTACDNLDTICPQVFRFRPGRRISDISRGKLKIPRVSRFTSVLAIGARSRLVCAVKRLHRTRPHISGFLRQTGRRVYNFSPPHFAAAFV